MTDQTLNLAVILGSVRNGRFGPVVAQWFLDEARHHGAFSIDHIDLAETPLPHQLPGSHEELLAVDERSPDLRAIANRLQAADAFVLVTPEYNHGYPASLKHLIDWHYTEWRAKPVGFVSYGGVSGGLRAVEQLRAVFGEMHAVDVRDSVSFDIYWERFGDDGRPLDAEGPSGAAKLMLDQLAWWGAALRDARLKTPYGTAA